MEAVRGTLEPVSINRHSSLPLYVPSFQASGSKGSALKPETPYVQLETVRVCGCSGNTVRLRIAAQEQRGSVKHSIETSNTHMHVHSLASNPAESLPDNHYCPTASHSDIAM